MQRNNDKVKTWYSLIYVNITSIHDEGCNVLIVGEIFNFAAQRLIQSSLLPKKEIKKISYREFKKLNRVGGTQYTSWNKMRKKVKVGADSCRSGCVMKK